MMKYRLEELVDINKLQELTDELFTVTAIPSAIVSRDGKILTSSGWQKICSDFHRKYPAAEKECIGSDMRDLKLLNVDEVFEVYQCPHGLVDAVSPIIIAKEHVANVFSGQVFFEQPDKDIEAFFRKQSRVYGFNEEAYIQAFRQVPVVSETKFRAGLSLLNHIARLVVDMGIARLQALEAEEAVRHSEERYRLVLETINDGVVLLSESGEILTWNKGAERILGISSQKAIGWNVRQRDWPIIKEDGTKCEYTDLPSTLTLQSGQPCREKILGIHSDADKSIWISVNTNPIFMKNEDKPCAVTVSFSDITDLKREKDQSQQYLDIAGVMLLALNKKGEVTLVNKKACKILESSEKKLLGKNWFLNFLPSEENEKIKMIFDQLLQGQEVQTEYVESRILTASGKEKLIAWHNVALKTEKDGIIGTLSSGEDITEAKQAEASLRYERDLIERLMETSPIGIFHVDADGLVVYGNKRSEEILGIQIPDVTQCTYNNSSWRITDAEGKPFSEDKLPFMRVKRTGKPVHNVIHSIEWPDGRHAFLSVNATPLCNVSGEFDGIVATIEDITEKQRAEQNYHMLFREMLDGFALHEVICDQQGRPVDYRFLDVNPAFERLTNLKSELLVGKTVLEVLPNTEPYWIERFGSVAVTGKPDFFDNYSREIGRYFQVTAFRYARNQFACIFVDITDRKRAEQERIKLQRQLTNAVEIANLGHWEYDIARDLFTFNDQLYRIFRTTAEKVGGYTMSSEEYASRFVHPEARHAFQAQKKLAVETNDPNFKGQLEHRMMYADGSPGYISVLYYIEKDQQGRTTKVCGVHQDITERKKIEERLQQAQKMESIGNLAGGIAHDFNNILFPIVGMAEMLMEDLPPESLLYDNAREILNAGKRGSDLVKQILAFSRHSAHKKEPVRIQQILREALKLSRASIPADIEISYHIQGDCGLVSADPTQVHQVIMNLITNAYHAVSSTRGSIGVQLKEMNLKNNHSAESGLEPGRYVLLSIKDNGHGIDPSVKQKIFDPYFTTKEQGKGTGLGLAVVYGIVKDHKGGISVLSRKGKGTIFNIYFPVLEKTIENLVSENMEIDQTGHESILVVDDEISVARLEKQMLERMGYQVSAYSSSVGALKAFKANPGAYELVISDMTMPKMDGYHLTTALKKIKPDISVIICTGFSERINPQKFKAIGIKGVLIKPIVKAKMARMVRKVLDSAGLKALDEP